VRLGWLLAAALLASGCGSDETDPDANQSRLHGTVRDAISGDGIKGVKVRFVSDTLDEASDTTDGDGRYGIDVATDSDQGHLEASKAGYLKRIVPVYLDAASVEIDIELDK
jgi:hypothetical protein